MPELPHINPRYSLMTLLAGGSALALAVGWAASAGRWGEERTTLLALIPNGVDVPNQYVLENFPITIVMCNDGGYGPEGWQLSVNSKGEAVLNDPTADPPISQSFQFTHEQQRAIRDLLISERFFELKDRYGDLVPDAPSHTLTIVVGEYSKTVTLDYLRWSSSDPYYDTNQLRESARALRVYLEIRNAFPQSAVSDERPYLQRALQAAEKLEAESTK